MISFWRVLFEFNLSCIFFTGLFLFVFCLFLKNHIVYFGFVFQFFGVLLFCVQT